MTGEDVNRALDAIEESLDGVEIIERDDYAAGIVPEGETGGIPRGEAVELADTVRDEVAEFDVGVDVASVQRRDPRTYCAMVSIPTLSGLADDIDDVLGGG